MIGVNTEREYWFVFFPVVMPIGASTSYIGSRPFPFKSALSADSSAYVQSFLILAIVT